MASHGNGRLFDACFCVFAHCAKKENFQLLHFVQPLKMCYFHCEVLYYSRPNKNMDIVQKNVSLAQLRQFWLVHIMRISPALVRPTDVLRP